MTNKLLDRFNAAWEEEHGMSSVVDGFGAVEFARSMLHQEIEAVLRSSETDSGRIARFMRLSEEAK